MKKISILVISFFISQFLCTNALLAGDYDIKQMTPAIQQALDKRKARYSALQALKAEGVIGEDAEGFVTALKANDQATSLVGEENRDRSIIYEAIADQNGLGPAGLQKVKQVFADVQREKARPGDLIETPGGNWVKK